MKIPNWLTVYGNIDYRGDCPHEDYALASFFDRIRKDYPSSYGLVAFHPKNEGKRSHTQVKVDKLKGMTKGVTDVIIIGNPTLVLELKRDDHTKSKWQPMQIEFMEQCYKGGAHVVLALGYKAAIQAFEDWIKLQP